MLAERSIAALLLVVVPSLVSAASNVPHYADVRGGAAQNASSVYATTSSPTVLDLVDVTLNAPKGAATCASVDVTWTWDMTGTPPSDPIAISIIDASTLGAVTTRRRKRGPSRHSEWKQVSDFLSKRAASIRGTILPGAGSLPFNEVSYTWNPVNVSPGSYRLLLTIVSSGEAVVSDPFGIEEGSTACFSTASTSTSASSSSPTATSSSVEPANTTSTAPSASSSDIDSSVSSTSAAPAASNPSSSSSASTAPDSSAASSSSPGDHGHKAVIAAAVATPLLLLVVFIYGWRLWKKQSSERNQTNESSRPVWAEKFFGGGGSAGANANLLRSPSTTRPTGHRREISGPGLATPAGLAAVAGMVPVELRKEKDEMALRAVPPPNVPYSPDPQDCDERPDHWIDFSDHDVQGARPLSAATIADSARLEPRDNSGKPAGLYGQGRNVPLRPESSQCPSTGDSISTFGNDPLRASNTSGVSLGRDLIAAMPQPPSHQHSAPSSSTPSIISPFADPPAPEELSRALTQHHEEGQTSGDSSTEKPVTVQRSDSSGSSFGVKRKPVPRISVNGASTDSNIGASSVDEGPFGNEHAVANESTTSIPIASVADARAESPVELIVPREPTTRARADSIGDQPYHLSVARQSGFDINFSTTEEDKPAGDAK